MVQLPYNKQGLGLYVYYAKLKKIRRKINLDFFLKKNTSRFKRKYNWYENCVSDILGVIRHENIIALVFKLDIVE